MAHETPDAHDMKPATETNGEIPQFVETVLDSSQPARCVDGRPHKGVDTRPYTGPQMLGGSLLPVLLSAIEQHKWFDRDMVSNGIAKLREQGITPGVHRGHHKHGDASDCGFADRMPGILETAITSEHEITRRLMQAYEANKPYFEQNRIDLPRIIANAYKALVYYSPGKIILTGEALIKAAEHAGATAVDVMEDHKEQVAFVNLKEGVTLDTNGLNKEGKQGFGFDVLPALNHAEALGVNRTFALGASLILYQATEMVLVEKKGKPALPVVLHY